LIKYYYSKDQVRGKLQKMAASDSLFSSDASFAYAYAWAITFYLSEKQPAKYFKFIAADAARDDFSALSSKQRLAMFAKQFGSDFKGLESRIERFISQLDHK